MRTDMIKEVLTLGQNIIWYAKGHGSYTGTLVGARKESLHGILWPSEYGPTFHNVDCRSSGLIGPWAKYVARRRSS